MVDKYRERLENKIGHAFIEFVEEIIENKDYDEIEMLEELKESIKDMIENSSYEDPKRLEKVCQGLSELIKAEEINVSNN